MFKNIVVYCDFSRLKDPEPPRPGCVSLILLRCFSPNHVALEVSKRAADCVTRPRFDLKVTR